MTALTYRAAGVDPLRAEQLLQAARPFFQATQHAGVRHLPAFAGLLELPAALCEASSTADRPLLVASCDGVGTKARLAQAARRLEVIGRDAVVVNLNDLAVVGAQPLFFLDYLAAARLDPSGLLPLFSGMSAICRQVGCPLLGGETAELPGTVIPGALDVVGFAVGWTRSSCLPVRRAARVGDVILGLPASGLHANGYSLVRRVLQQRHLAPTLRVPGTEQTLQDALLTPVPLYLEAACELLARHPPPLTRALAAVTGGGLLGRAGMLVEPDAGLCAQIDPSALPIVPVLALLAEAGPIAFDELARTFHLGIGFLALLDADAARAEQCRPGSPWRTIGTLRAASRVAAIGSILHD